MYFAIDVSKLRGFKTSALVLELVSFVVLVSMPKVHALTMQNRAHTLNSFSGIKVNFFSLLLMVVIKCHICFQEAVRNVVLTNSLV